MAASEQFIVHVTRNQRRLYAFIRALVWDPGEADDLLQETNLALWKKSDEFDGSREFMPWAMQFARLQVLAWLKRQRVQRRARGWAIFNERLVDELAADAVDGESPEANLFERRLLALSACLQKLPAAQRDLIARRYEPGAKVNGMAARLHLTPKALSDRLRRIRISLLACVEKTLSAEMA